MGRMRLNIAFNLIKYAQITAIGRYGMSTTKCRIPIGTFYGHSYVLASDGYAEEKAYFRPNSELNIQVRSFSSGGLFAK